MWVSAADAAEAVGVTPQLVRSWVEQGFIVSRHGKGATGFKTFVRLDEVTEKAHELPQTETAGGTPSSDLAPLFKALPDLITDLQAATERAARAEMKVEFLTEKIADLRAQVKEAKARPASPPAERSVEPQPEHLETTPVIADAEPEIEPETIENGRLDRDLDTWEDEDIWDDSEKKRAAANQVAGGTPPDLWRDDEDRFMALSDGSSDDDPPPDLWAPDFNRVVKSDVRKLRDQAQAAKEGPAPKSRKGLFRRRPKEPR
jgi:hypothetical protein